MSFLNKIIVSIVEMMPKSSVRFFSGKYIAGDSLQSAVDLVKELNSNGILATLDLLGESANNEVEANAAFNKTIKIFDALVENKLDANLSIKPTQLGLSFNKELAFNNILQLVKRAHEIDNFVRIDMEDSPYTDDTIEIYKKIFEEYDNVGVVLQSYLKRTYNDTILLNKLGTDYRLCKGIYIESPSIAYRDKQTIRDNYVKVLDSMLKNGNYVGIATHDDYLIEEAYRLINEYKVPGEKFEFQMLLGVRTNLQNKILKDGHKLRIYVPFGEDWYPYSIRRLKENPQIAGHIVRNIFSFEK